MTRPPVLLVSLVATAPVAAIACGGNPAGPEAPSARYEVTVTPRRPEAAPVRFAGNQAGHLAARIPVDERQTIWRSQLTVRLMTAADRPVMVLVLVFPDTGIRYGRIDLERVTPGPFPARLVARGQVVREDGRGLYDIESGQLELTQGRGGVIEGAVIARLVPVAPAGASVEVVADAVGHFVAHRITW